MCIHRLNEFNGGILVRVQRCNDHEHEQVAAMYVIIDRQ